MNNPFENFDLFLGFVIVVVHTVSSYYMKGMSNGTALKICFQLCKYY